MSILRSSPGIIPLHVVCVLEDDMYDDEMVEYVEYDCNERGLDFTTRIFDSWTHSVDKDEITSLPAFHIYLNGVHQMTTYPDDNPLEKIDECFKKYENELQQKARPSWRQRLVSIIPKLKRRNHLIVREVREPSVTPPKTSPNPMREHYETAN